MRYLILIIAMLLISSCMNLYKTKKSYTHSKKKGDYVSLYNEGTICTQKEANFITVKYYPLSTNCVSSSQIEWKLLGLDSKIDKNSLKLSSYALYKIKHPSIATTDCAGAGVKIKTIELPSTIDTIYWGDAKLNNLTQNSTNIECFQKNRDGIKRVKPF